MNWDKLQVLFVFIDNLGQGSYAQVRVAQDTLTQEKVAIKMYDKFKLMDTTRKNNVKREIQILKELNHKNIIKLITTIDTRQNINLIMEYGGS